MSGDTKEILRSPLTSTVKIFGRRPLHASSRDIELYYKTNKERIKKSVSVSRPTRFDNVMAVVVEEISSPPSSDINWPVGLRDAARQAYHTIRETKSRFMPAFQHSSPMFDMRSIEPNNIAHLLTDCIPMSLYAKDALGTDIINIFGKIREPFTSLLKEFDLDVVCTSKRVQGPIVHVRGSRCLQFYDLPGLHDCPGVSFFPNIFERFSFPTASPVPKIYLARRGVRSVLNNEEVERIVESRGYKTVYMEDYSVREQLAIAQHAEHVVAVHGAAMALLVVNRGIGSLIELFPPHTYHEIFALSLPQVERYAVLLPDFDDTVPNRGWNVLRSFKDAPFAVDLEMLERALDEIAR